MMVSWVIEPMSIVGRSAQAGIALMRTAPIRMPTAVEP
jgi:hypothetical protein